MTQTKTITKSKNIFNIERVLFDDDSTIKCFNEINEYIAVHGFDEKVEEFENKIIELGRPRPCFQFAKIVKGAHIDRHQEVVIKSGDLYCMYYFAKQVKGSDVKTLKTKILKANNMVSALIKRRDLIYFAQRISDEYIPFNVRISKARKVINNRVKALDENDKQKD